MVPKRRRHASYHPEASPDDPNNIREDLWKLPFTMCLAADQQDSPSNSFSILSQQVTKKGNFREEQKQNDCLKYCWTQVWEMSGRGTRWWKTLAGLVRHCKKTGQLYYCTQRRGEECNLLLSPQQNWQSCMWFMCITSEETSEQGAHC